MYLGIGLHIAAQRTHGAGAPPSATITVTSQPSAAGLTAATAGETHTAIVSRLTNLGTATTDGAGGVTTTVTLMTSGGDPVAEGDLISNIRFIYTATDAAAVIVDVAVNITVAAGAGTLTPSTGTVLDIGGGETVTLGTSTEYIISPDRPVIWVKNTPGQTVTHNSLDGSGGRNGMEWNPGKNTSNVTQTGFESLSQGFDVQLRNHNGSESFLAARNVHPDYQTQGAFTVPGEGNLVVCESLSTNLAGWDDPGNTLSAYGTAQRAANGGVERYVVVQFVDVLPTEARVRRPLRGEQVYGATYATIDANLATHFQNIDMTDAVLHPKQTPAERATRLAAFAKQWFTWGTGISQFSHLNPTNANNGYGRQDSQDWGELAQHLHSTDTLANTRALAYAICEQALDDKGMMQEGAFYQANGNWSTGRGPRFILGGVLMGDTQMLNLGLSVVGASMGGGQTITRPVHTEGARYAFITTNGVAGQGFPGDLGGLYLNATPKTAQSSSGRAKRIPHEAEDVGYPGMTIRRFYGQAADEGIMCANFQMTYLENISGSQLGLSLAMQLLVSPPSLAAYEPLFAFHDRYVRVARDIYDGNSSADDIGGGQKITVLTAEYGDKITEFYTFCRDNALISRPAWTGRPERCPPPEVEVVGSTAIVVFPPFRHGNGHAITTADLRYRFDEADPWVTVTDVIADVAASLQYALVDMGSEVRMPIVQVAYNNSQGRAPWSTNLPRIDFSNTGDVAGTLPRGIGFEDQSDPAYVPSSYYKTSVEEVEGETDEDDGTVTPSLFVTGTLPSTGNTSYKVNLSIWPASSFADEARIFDMLTNSITLTYDSVNARWEFRVQDQGRTTWNVTNAIWETTGDVPVVLPEKQWSQIEITIDSVAETITSTVNGVAMKTIPFALTGDGFLRGAVPMRILGGNGQASIPVGSRISGVAFERNGVPVTDSPVGDTAALANAHPWQVGSPFQEQIVLPDLTPTFQRIGAESTGAVSGDTQPVMPAGQLTGDLIILAMFENAGTEETTLAGFTHHDDPDVTNMDASLFTRVATADNESLPFLAGCNGAQVVVYRGASGIGAVDSTAVDGTGGGNPLVFPALTMQGTGSDVIAMAFSRSRASTDYVALPGYTEIANLVAQNCWVLEDVDAAPSATTTGAVHGGTDGLALHFEVLS